MKIERDKIHGSAAAGDRHSRHRWPVSQDDEDIDYEALFKSFIEKLFSNRGAFKLDGSLLFEFLPKARVKAQQLISSETAFYFHQYQEEQSHVEDYHGNDNLRYRNVGRYDYQNQAFSSRGSMEEFMPAI